MIPILPNVPHYTSNKRRVKKAFWNAMEKLVAHQTAIQTLGNVASVAVAVAALLYAVYSTRVLTKMQRDSMTPALVIQWVGGSGADTSLTLSNASYGPVAITWLRVLYDGDPIRSWPDFLDRAGVSDASKVAVNNGLCTMLSAGQTMPLISAKGFQPHLLQKIKQLKVDACVCTVLNECSEIHLSMSHAFPSFGYQDDRACHITNDSWPGCRDE